MTDAREVDTAFDAPARSMPPPADGEAFIVNIQGYEGPLDLLLHMARVQKVDLSQISILALVEQYLDFIAAARRLNLELAADYLVMAAWLAYLKSRLLLPREVEPENEPSARELAARLQLQLQRLEAMREAGARLMARDRLDRDVFARGLPEPITLSRTHIYDLTLFELLRTFGEITVRESQQQYRPQRRPIFALEAALRRLQLLIGTAMDWTELQQFLPPDTQGAAWRSVLASSFAASLELTRLRQAELQQIEPFGPLYIRHRAEYRPHDEGTVDDV